MKKIYIKPEAYDVYSDRLMVETDYGFNNGTGVTTNGQSKRNVFVFSDDSNILPTVSMDD